MKVLKAEEAGTMVVKCPNCNSILEVAPEDFHVPAIAYGDRDKWVYYECPVCGEQGFRKLKNLKNGAFQRKVAQSF